jgi:hypothetical protein
MTVLHQGMPYVAELGRLTVALFVEPRLRVGRALVRLVGALLLVEVALGVAAGSVPQQERPQACVVGAWGKSTLDEGRDEGTKLKKERFRIK